MRFFHSKKMFWFFLIVICLGVLLFGGIPYFQTAFAAPLQQQGCPGVCADGYYDGTDASPTFVGAEAVMSSAIPQVRDVAYSGMRIGLAQPKISNINNGGFIEEGWEISPLAHFFSTSRFVYATWCNTSGACPNGGYQSMMQLTNGDYSYHTYTVVRKNTTLFLFRFDGVEQGQRQTLDWKKGWSVICGGEASSSSNAIGVSECLSVSYKKSQTGWILIPSHSIRLTPNYNLVDYSASGWIVWGNN